MKFIKTDGSHYFNSNQILAFVISEECGSDNFLCYTVNVVPVNAEYRDDYPIIETFDRLEDAEKFLAELVKKLNAEQEK